jgi:hypothetical protein
MTTNRSLSVTEHNLVNFALAHDLTPAEASRLPYCVNRIKTVMAMTESAVLWEMQTNAALAKLVVSAVKAD